jgi:hypothetical protein
VRALARGGRGGSLGGLDCPDHGHDTRVLFPPPGVSSQSEIQYKRPVHAFNVVVELDAEIGLYGLHGGSVPDGQLHRAELRRRGR